MSYNEKKGGNTMSKKIISTNEMRKLSGTVKCSDSEYRDCMSFYKYWYSMSYSNALTTCNRKFGLNCK